MGRYLARRLLQMIPLLVLISIASFLIMHLSPGDPVAMFVPPDRRQLSAQDIAAIRARLGLDKPVYVQYIRWLNNMLHGDWGYSLANKAPVRIEILSRLPNTMLLGAAALLLAVILAIPIGSLSALKQYSFVDYATTAFAFAGISIPGFWFAIILVQIFARRLGWLPSVGMHSAMGDYQGLAQVWDVLRHLILPALVLSLAQMGMWMRYQRSSLLEVLGQDYIRTARAKGLLERAVLMRHALRNALIPVITMAGLSLPMIVNGAYIVETIFGWPGMGRLGVGAIFARDYPVVMGVTMLSSLLVVLGNLLADITYAFVDPRIRHA